jgi:hypothetical protein
MTRITGREKRPGQCAQVRSAPPARNTTGCLPRVILRSGAWLLPVISVWLLSASIGYAMTIAIHQNPTSSAVPDTLAAESISGPLDLQDDLAVENAHMPSAACRAALAAASQARDQFLDRACK